MKNPQTDFTLSLTGLIRPSRLEWILNYTPHQVLDSIKSKSTKKALRKIDEIITENKLSITIEPLTQDTYTDWLTYYSKKMVERGYSILAQPVWFEEAKGRYLSLYIIDLVKNEQRIGAGIFAQDESGKWTLCFKASDIAHLIGGRNVSTGMLIEYLFMDYADKQGAQIISSGRSRNAFGFYNSFGYFNFKTRMGYEAKNIEITELLNTVPHLEKSEVGFYAYKENDPKRELSFYIFSPLQEVSNTTQQELLYSESSRYQE